MSVREKLILQHFSSASLHYTNFDCLYVLIVNNSSTIRFIVISSDRYHENSGHSNLFFFFFQMGDEAPFIRGR